MFEQPAKESQQFKRIFGRNLHAFWDFTGFDVVAFDEALEVPEGVSCAEYIRTNYGTEAEALIRTLLGVQWVQS